MPAENSLNIYYQMQPDQGFHRDEEARRIAEEFDGIEQGGGFGCNGFRDLQFAFGDAMDLRSARAEFLFSGFLLEPFEIACNDALDGKLPD